MNDIKLADAVQYIVVIMLDIACLTLGCLAWWQWCVYEINGQFPVETKQEVNIPSLSAYFVQN